MHSPLIVALDFSDKAKALALVDHLSPEECALKVGSEMFVRLGPSFVKELIAQKFRIFLDLKFHDIPNTVANACRSAADMGVWMMNVHASGGLKMMNAAREALLSYGNDRPLLIAVTILTSIGEEDFKEVYREDTLKEKVLHFARLTRDAGLDGVVCSAFEVPEIKALCGSDFLAVTPGIRPLEGNKDDQVRVVTPEKACELGSDYIVMGRAISLHSNPEAMVKNILTAFVGK